MTYRSYQADKTLACEVGIHILILFCPGGRRAVSRLRSSFVRWRSAFIDLYSHYSQFEYLVHDQARKLRFW